MEHLFDYCFKLTYREKKIVSLSARKINMCTCMLRQVTATTVKQPTGDAREENTEMVGWREGENEEMSRRNREKNATAAGRTGYGVTCLDVGGICECVILWQTRRNRCRARGRVFDRVPDTANSDAIITGKRTRKTVRGVCRCRPERIILIIITTQYNNKISLEGVNTARRFDGDNLQTRPPCVRVSYVCLHARGGGVLQCTRSSFVLARAHTPFSLFFPTPAAAIVRN